MTAVERLTPPFGWPLTVPVDNARDQLLAAGLLSSVAIRQASNLIGQTSAANPVELLRALTDQARSNPVRAAQLLVVLADIAADALRRIQAAQPSADPVEHARYLRSAHTRYSFHGERTTWAVEGEREYQRMRGRRRRATSSPQRE